MQSLPEAAALLKLAILVGLVVTVVALIRIVVSMLKAKHGSWFMLVMAGLLFLGVTFFFVGSARVSHIPTATVEATIAPDAAEKITTDPSIEALWDKLTKSKINLDGESDANPMAQSGAESSKDTEKKQDNQPPSWVINPPKRFGQVLRESVASDPFVTETECRRQLEQEILPHAVARQIGYLASAKMGHSVTIESPLAVGVGLDYIFREICRDEFTTTVDSSVGEMKKTHVLLEFNPSVDRYLADAWLRSERHARLAHFGKIAGLSLTGLAVAYGLLRFDTWSRGYYSKQLLMGSLLAIIAVAVVYLRS